MALPAMIAGNALEDASVAMDMLSAQQAREQEEQAAAENYRRAMQDRALMLDLYHQSRGSTGSAILPEYFGLGDQSFERRAASDAMGIYDATNQYFGTPEQRIQKFATVANLTSPARQQAAEKVNDLFGGQYLAQSTASAQPVYAARTAAGKTAKAGYMTALTAKLNEMAASDRARGFSGKGSFAQRNLLGTSASYNQAGAAAEAAAAMDNAIQQAALEDEVRKLQLANVFLPANVAASNVQGELLPVTAAGQSYAAQMQPFEFYRIGNQVPYGAIVRQPDQPIIPSENQIFIQGWGNAFQTMANQLKMNPGGGGGGEQQNPYGFMPQQGQQGGGQNSGQWSGSGYQYPYGGGGGAGNVWGQFNTQGGDVGAGGGWSGGDFGGSSDYGDTTWGDW